MTTRRGPSVSRGSTSHPPSFSPQRSPAPRGRPAVVEDSIGGSFTDALKSYGVPLATVALCGVGAVYFAKRMSDLETKVDAGRRNDVRHLNETDVRLIVQQMAKDGLINVPQWSAPKEQRYPDNRAQQQQQQQLAQQQQQQQLAQQQYEQRAAQAKQAQQQLFLQQQQAQAQHAQAPTSFPVAATAWKPKRTEQQLPEKEKEDE